MKAMYLVTGSNHTHARSLLQLLSTFRQWERWTRVVVYDLGLTTAQRQAVFDCDFNGSVETFPYDDYPAFFDIEIEAGQYAWKPALIQREISKSNAPICWMDAGNFVYRPLWGIRRALKKTGFYCPGSPGTLSEWVHPLMLKGLGLTSEFHARDENLNGACVAFDPTNPPARQLAEDWARFAGEREIIAPLGSNRANHRQDQSLLSVLAYRANMVGPRLPHMRGFSVHRDLPEDTVISPSPHSQTPRPARGISQGGKQ